MRGADPRDRDLRGNPRGRHDEPLDHGGLEERGILESCEALVVGKPETPGTTANERETYRRRQRRTIAATVDEYDTDLPVVFDLDFGHPAPDLPLPLDAPMTIDTAARTIRFTQS